MYIRIPIRTARRSNRTLDSRLSRVKASIPVYHFTAVAQPGSCC